MRDFNTSNVTIQRDVDLIPQVCKKISIHLMLLFNAIEPSIGTSLAYFNTSNVTIQLVRREVDGKSVEFQYI